MALRDLTALESVSTSFVMLGRSAPLDLHPHHDVLVVDDFTATRDAIVTMLLTKEYRAAGATSALHALELLRVGMHPCVMILDILMPEVDGWELWERMKADDDLRRISVVIRQHGRRRAREACRHPRVPPQAR